MGVKHNRNTKHVAFHWRLLIINECDVQAPSRVSLIAKNLTDPRPTIPAVGT